MSKPDVINHPSHYTRSGIETIDVIEAWGLNFHLGNAVKYISRAGFKGEALEDLKKARWYLDREIQRQGKQVESKAVRSESDREWIMTITDRGLDRG